MVQAVVCGRMRLMSYIRLGLMLQLRAQEGLRLRLAPRRKRDAATEENLFRCELLT